MSYFAESDEYESTIKRHAKQYAESKKAKI